jgi:hypothetical protein
MALIREYLPERAYIHELGVTDYETSLGRNLHQDFQKQKNIYILLNSDPHALVGLILASTHDTGETKVRNRAATLSSTWLL